MSTKSARVRFGPHWLEMMFILVGVIETRQLNTGNPPVILGEQDLALRAEILHRLLYTIAVQKGHTMIDTIAVQKGHAKQVKQTDGIPFRPIRLSG